MLRMTASGDVDMDLRLFGSGIKVEVRLGGPKLKSNLQAINESFEKGTGTY